MTILKICIQFSMIRDYLNLYISAIINRIKYIHLQLKNKPFVHILQPLKRIVRSYMLGG